MTANPAQHPPVLADLPPDRASSLPRRVLCPGSRLAEHGLPDTESEDSKLGTFRHALLAGTETTDNLDELELIGRTVRLREHLAEDCFGRDVEVNMVKKEVNVWLYDGIRPINDGHLDHLLVVRVHTATGWEMHALVTDYKMVGRIPKTPAELHMQLRDYAVAVYKAYGFPVIYAAIIQPWAPKESQVTCVRFSEADGDFDACFNELLTLDLRTRDMKAKRCPSKAACEYCKACGIPERCPESVDAAMVPVQAIFNGGPRDKQAIAEKVASLDLTMLARLMDELPLAKAVFDSIESRARKELAQNPDAFADCPSADGKCWTLKEGNNVRSITKPDIAFMRTYEAVYAGAKTSARQRIEKWTKKKREITDKVADRYISMFTVSKARQYQEAYVAAAVPPIKAVETAYRAATQCTWNEAKEQLETILGDCLKTNQNAPSLVAVPMLEDRK